MHQFVPVDCLKRWGYLIFDALDKTFRLEFVCGSVQQTFFNLCPKTLFEQNQTWKVALCDAKDGGKDYLVFFEINLVEQGGHFANGQDPGHEFRLAHCQPYDMNDIVSVTESLKMNNLPFPFMSRNLVFLEQWPPVCIKPLAIPVTLKSSPAFGHFLWQLYNEDGYQPLEIQSHIAKHVSRQDTISKNIYYNKLTGMYQ